MRRLFSSITVHAAPKPHHQPDLAGKDARVAVVDGYVTSPDGSINSSDGSICSSDVSICSSDGSIRSSDVSIRSSDVSICSSDVSICSSDVFIHSSDVSIHSSDGSIHSSDVSIDSSDGYTTSPDGYMAAKNGYIAVVDVERRRADLAVAIEPVEKGGRALGVLPRSDVDHVAREGLSSTLGRRARGGHAVGLGGDDRERQPGGRLPGSLMPGSRRTGDAVGRGPAGPRSAQAASRHSAGVTTM